MFTQFNSLIDLLAKFPTEQACFEHLEMIRWAGNVISPFDPNSRVYTCKPIKKGENLINRYKCKNTGKYFNVRTGTIFEDTKAPLQKWFIALYLLSSHKKGISSHQLAKDLNVTQKTAWFMLQRLRYAFNHPVFKAKLGNTVEADELYVGGKDSNKHASKKVGQASGQGGANKMIVVGVVERGGHLIAQHINPETGKGDSIRGVIQSNVRRGSNLMTDESGVYDRLRREYVRAVVNHSAKQYVNGKAHTNTIEGFWSQVQRGINGIYHWVSYKHLQKYINEYALRYNSRKFPESARFNLILTNMVGRITYKELTAQ